MAQNKCGEIYTSDQEIFTYLCTFCSILLEDINKFISHVSTRHTHEAGKADKIEDPLKPSDSYYEDSSIKLEPNIQVELMDDAEMLLTSINLKSLCDNNAENIKKVLEQEGEAECNTYLSSDHGNNKMHLKSRKRKRKSRITVFCDICDKGFGSDKILESHKTYDHRPTDPFIKLSTKNQPDALSDDDDDESNHEEKAENERTLIQSIKDDPLKCRYCGRRFGTRKERAEHECIHTGEKFYKCNICGKCFRLNSIYNTHIKIHKNDRPHKCEVCNATFKDKTNLNVHIRRHLGEKRFKCNFCEKTFVQNTEKKIHERIHTGEKPFQCVTCGNRFKTSSQMAAHNRIHAGIRPYKCKECDKGFNTNTELKSHSVSHTGERPFSCEICKATFPRRKSLISHKKIHSDIAEYVCKICGKSFKQGPGLYCHMKSHGEISTNNKS